VAVGVVGELLITFGVLVLLFAVYELTVTDYRAAASQHRLQRQLAQAWAGPHTTRGRGDGPFRSATPPAVSDGQGFAVIRIPRFGGSYQPDRRTHRRRARRCPRRGRMGGPRFKMSPTNMAQARSMYDAGQHTVQQIADTFGVSRPTIYRHLGTALPAPPKAAADTKQHGQPSRPRAVPARPAAAGRRYRAQQEAS